MSTLQHLGQGAKFGTLWAGQAAGMAGAFMLCKWRSSVLKVLAFPVFDLEYIPGK